jgi:GNAT superfamily N-acetyltransferase
LRFDPNFPVPGIVMKQEVTFRPYSCTDRDACLAIFDANCPLFFAPGERADFQSFLDSTPDGYEVCEVDGRLMAAFGFVPDGVSSHRLVWIMLDPAYQGGGVGSAIMRRIIALGRASQSQLIKIAASHKSAPFFAKFGAVATVQTEEGWGPGMDRVDMELAL